VGGLHIGYLAFSEPRRAIIKDRNLKGYLNVDTVYLSRMTFSVFKFPLDLGPGGKGDIRHDARSICQSILQGNSFEFEHRRSKIDPACKGFSFKAVAGSDFWQARQRVWHVVVQICTEETENPRQVFFGKFCCKVSLRFLARKFCGKRMFAGLIVPAQITGLAKFGSQFGSSISRFKCLADKTCRFKGRNSVDPCASRLCCNTQRLLGSRKLGFPEPDVSNAVAALLGRQCNQAGGNAAFNRAKTVKALAAQTEYSKMQGRVRGKSDLPCVGGRQTQIGICRLKSAIVQQCNLHRCVSRDGFACDECRNALGICRDFFRRLQPDDVSTRRAFGRVGDRAEASSR